MGLGSAHVRCMSTVIPSLEDLEREVQDLTSKLSAANALLEAARAYASLHDQGEGKTVVHVRKRLRVLRPSSTAMEQTEQAAAALMDMWKRPIQTGEIVRKQADLGHDLPENASNVVSARMSNSAKFEGRRGQGWWFADRPWPGEDDMFEDTEGDGVE